MNVIKVTPRGYCLGVVKSIKWAKDAAKQYHDKEIFMLGYLVHNQHVVKEIIDLGIIPINDYKQNRLDLLKNLPNNSVVILSAHGSDERIKTLAAQKNIIIVDTECEWVTATKDLIREFLAKKDYEIIFIGKTHHPETNAILSISPLIHLVTTVTEIEPIIPQLDHTKKILITNQTTLSKIDIEDIVLNIKNQLPERIIEFKNDLCNATLERQNAVLALDSDQIDLLLVVGDKRSNNTLKLVEMGERKNILSYRINDKNDIKDEWLKNINTVAVTAGASTPSNIQLEVIKYLEEQ
ncbi:4-hydroxy-3-methylbut-2-enyl diphosphate reductase [Spiroplasma chrysopicola]|uniref:4-hydroxy-3-methylbut-2-enyl diphosphate reductase n=1 Tax=Spiroplasma chrysopicola DF-1 TaxID=1276227 RepID=R4U350_9MOLU|nr:4-hydroxy-3-methylbut-2-enyl diphosphate reductase [Spiroplasma chrysopicola]AGM24918.1 4-hydroxy-3-methylbut-2-enyl diphosphate reductase [Spiroplasma chrysopicola DF-1]